MIRIYNYLQENPREVKETDMTLLEISINYYHLISLLWNPQNKKYTNDFLIWKTQEILELLTTILPTEQDVVGFNNAILEWLKSYEKVGEDQALPLMGAIGQEFDNYMNNKNAIPIDVKIGVLLKLLSFKNITLEQIFAKY